jgi:activator of HSP90 ATPase
MRTPIEIKARAQLLLRQQIRLSEKDVTEGDFETMANMMKESESLVREIAVLKWVMEGDIG